MRIGDKVVCVDDGDIQLVQDEIGPVRGEIYTIRDIRLCKDAFIGVVVGLHLEEIRNERYRVDKKEVYFRSYRFRPVVRTSIEIFTAMLKPVLEDA
jgi:hypothetical protein